MYSHYPISPSPYGVGYASANSAASLSVSLSASAGMPGSGVPPQSSAAYAHPHYAYHPASPAPPYAPMSKGLPMGYALPHTPAPTTVTQVPSDIQSGADALFQVANNRKRLRNESDDSSSSGGSGSSHPHSLSPQPSAVTSSPFRPRNTTAYGATLHANGDYTTGYMDADMNGDGYGSDYSMKLARRSQEAMSKYAPSTTLMPPSSHTLHPNMNVHMHMQVPRALTNAAANGYMYSPNGAMPMPMPVPMQQATMHGLHPQSAGGPVMHSHSPVPSVSPLHAHSLSYTGNGSQSTSTPASSSAPSAGSSSSTSSHPSNSALGSASSSSTPVTPSQSGSRASPSGGHAYRDDEKKRKHQETDRQRRQKIKDGMEALRLFVDHDASLKADQATIVGRSVELIKEMKAEISSLRKKLMETESTQMHSNNAESAANRGVADHEGGNVADPSSKMVGVSGWDSKEPSGVAKKRTKDYALYDAVLNAAGVAFWRTCLAGRITEVNSIFEQISGFTAASLVGTVPCLEPLNVTLSIMPASITRLFSSVAENPNSTPSTPATGSSEHKGRTKTNAPPLFTINLSSLPAIPDSELVPYCENEKMLKDVVEGYGPAHEAALAVPTPKSPSASSSSSSSDDSNSSASASSSTQESSEQFGQLPCVHPKPNGAFLLKHLSKLPAGSVLKLFSRHDTAHGDTIEAVLAIQLVRSEDGKPDHMIVMSTPDSRRLIKRPAETHIHSC